MSLSNQEAQSILLSFVEKYTTAIVKDNFDVAIHFYHPDAVLVHKTTKAMYGKDEIYKFFKTAEEQWGSTIKNVNSNEHYQGTKDYIIYNADYDLELSKAGTLKGKFLQIWKKEGDEYLVYHDEFEIVQ